MVASLAVLALVLSAPKPVPYYFRHQLQPADLQGKTLGELNLIRNTIYARAGNVFRKAWLKDYFAHQPWYRPTGMDDDRLSETDRANAKIVTDFELAIPADELRTHLGVLEAPVLDGGAIPAAPTPVPKEVEIALLREDLGIPDPASTSPLENPALLDQLVSVKQLDDLSPRELRLLRNLIYARRGRAFASKDLQRYFGRASWYHADPTFTEARLTATDQKNIRIVQSVEDQARDAGFGDRQPGEMFLMRA